MTTSISQAHLEKAGSHNGVTHITLGLWAMFSSPTHALVSEDLQPLPKMGDGASHSVIKFLSQVSNSDRDTRKIIN